MPLVRLFFWICLLLLAVLVGCAGHGTDAALRVPPRLSAESLGGLKHPLTYSGDWVGGVPAEGSTEAAIDLARRRGVGLFVDLTRPSGGSPSMEELVRAAGMNYVAVDPADAELALGDGSTSGAKLGDSHRGPALAAVRRLLTAPGRPAALLVDESGTLAPVLYGVYLVHDVGLRGSDVMDALRASGISGEAVERLIMGDAVSEP